MKAFLLSLLLLSSALSADSLPLSPGGSGSIVTGTASLVFKPLYSGVVTLQVTGTWYANLIPQVSLDGTNYLTANCFTQTGGLTASITGNGVFRVDTSGFSYMRITSTAYTGGTAAVTYYSAPNSTQPNEGRDLIDTVKVLVGTASVASAWYPASGKRWRLKGYRLNSNVTGAITLFDGATTISSSMGLASATASPIYFGTGKQAAAVGTTLTVSGPGALWGDLFGTEE